MTRCCPQDLSSASCFFPDLTQSRKVAQCHTITVQAVLGINPKARADQPQPQRPHCMLDTTESCTPSAQLHLGKRMLTISVSQSAQVRRRNPNLQLRFVRYMRRRSCTFAGLRCCLRARAAGSSWHRPGVASPRAQISPAFDMPRINSRRTRPGASRVEPKPSTTPVATSWESWSFSRKYNGNVTPQTAETPSQRSLASGSAFRLDSLAGEPCTFWHVLSNQPFCVCVCVWNTCELRFFSFVFKQGGHPCQWMVTQRRGPLSMLIWSLISSTYLRSSKVSV